MEVGFGCEEQLRLLSSLSTQLQQMCEGLWPAKATMNETMSTVGTHSQDSSHHSSRMAAIITTTLQNSLAGGAITSQQVQAALDELVKDSCLCQALLQDHLLRLFLTKCTDATTAECTPTPPDVRALQEVAAEGAEAEGLKRALTTSLYRSWYLAAQSVSYAHTNPAAAPTDVSSRQLQWIKGAVNYLVHITTTELGLDATEAPPELHAPLSLLSLTVLRVRLLGGYLQGSFHPGLVSCQLSPPGSPLDAKVQEAPLREIAVAAAPSAGGDGGHDSDGADDSIGFKVGRWDFSRGCSIATQYNSTVAGPGLA